MAKSSEEMLETSELRKVRNLIADLIPRLRQAGESLGRAGRSDGQRRVLEMGQELRAISDRIGEH